MDSRQQILGSRREASDALIQRLRDSLSAMDELAQAPQLAIYATGSYGRREASPHSDLDLFFVTEGDEKVRQIPKTLIDANLIRLTADLGLPQFSGDGEYLVIHQVNEMKSQLGTRHDDYENFFTARILLLLESVWLCHEDVYEAILEEIVETYFRDFPSHETDFRPLFLLNDIIRFWRTVCINYESGRHVEQNEERKRKARVKNLKLKFSRPFTCFSTVMHLVAEPGGIAPERILEVVHLPPAQRVELAAERLPKGAELAGAIFEEYGWFLEVTGEAPDEVLAWLADDGHHEEAMKRASRFDEALYRLVFDLAEQAELTRYLVI